MSACWKTLLMKIIGQRLQALLSTWLPKLTADACRFYRSEKEGYAGCASLNSPRNEKIVCRYERDACKLAD